MKPDDTRPVFSISDSMRVKMPVALLLSVLVGIVIGTWRISGALSELKGEIKAAAADRWTASDMQEWAYQLEQRNRNAGLAVPVPRQVRNERMAQERD